MPLVEVIVVASAHWRQNGSQTVTLASIEPILAAGIDSGDLSRKAYRMGAPYTYFVTVPDKLRDALIPTGRAILDVTPAHYPTLAYVCPEDVPVETSDDRITRLEEEVAKLKETVSWLLNRLEEDDGNL